MTRREQIEQVAHLIKGKSRNREFIAFVQGALWADAHLWKYADGDDLPEIDREVIVLYQRYPLENNEYAVGFAHRPPEYWDGKNIDTCEVTRRYPRKFGKGRWNIPDVKWWLDAPLPFKEGGE